MRQLAAVSLEHVNDSTLPGNRVQVGRRVMTTHHHDQRAVEELKT